MVIRFLAPLCVLILLETLLAVPDLAQTKNQTAPDASRRFSGLNVPDANAPAAAADPKAKAVELNNAAVKAAGSFADENAAELLLRAVSLDPHLSGAFLNLSIIYDRMKLYPQSLSAAQKAFEIDPANKTAHTQVCEMMMMSRMDAPALACYEELKNNGPLEDRSLRNYGLVLVRNGRVADAENTITAALQQMPDDIGLMNGLGLVRYKQKRYDEAIAIFKRLTEAHPDQGEIRFNLAISQLARQNRAGALSQYHLLEASDPKLADALYRMLFQDKVVYVGGNNK